MNIKIGDIVRIKTKYKKIILEESKHINIKTIKDFVNSDIVITGCYPKEDIASEYYASILDKNDIVLFHNEIYNITRLKKIKTLLSK